MLRQAEPVGTRNRARFLCRCECGTERPVRHDLLSARISLSCGCLARERSARRRTHGRTSQGRTNGDRTYVSWKGMKQRCYDQEHENYPNYGALGVSVCERWRNSFANFVADMGERADGMTLDRIDPAGNYEPSNCRWADWVTQNNNKRHQQVVA